MTTAEARDLGYQVHRGSYRDTTDDRIDRWYIERIDAPFVDRRGPGHPTRSDALTHLARRLDEDRAARAAGY